MPQGIELATEWVTLMPETAELVKRIKNFEPPPIHVKLIVDKQQGSAKSVIDSKAVVKEAEKTGKEAGEAVVKQTEKAVQNDSKVEKAAAKTGESIKREMVKPIQKVSDDIAKSVDPSKQQGRLRSAAARVGQAIRDGINREIEKAGDDSGKKLAAGIERAKAAVTKAERSLADARIAASNIESRIGQQEARIQALRNATAEGLKRIAAEEDRYNDMRANSAKHTADDIVAQERKLKQMQSAQENRVVRLNAAEASRDRLLNSRQTVMNREANALDNLSSKEAALATALSLQNDPLDDTGRKMRQASDESRGFFSSLVPLGRQLLITSGLFTGALGLGGAITFTLRKGNEFTDSINKMTGILNSSGAEIAAINDKARELGRAIDLPAVSANDAASAMLELTKAGFSAQQAMDAAKGSLQLSAAAGVDASEAAYITGTALNAFGLAATDASKITDILANAANLFPGEMKDFGYSLSQAGAVAKSFGVDIEDTTTALGFLAQAGIKSSDAGTLIKTMLLSLTDQGKPAQAAMTQLGLELYDQQGKFKGLEYVYKRLQQASKELTQEQYQAATSTLFGTDAARFAGLAAGEASPNWDEFRQKIDDTGAAARVANARLQGLPGALEKLKNAGESLALTIYDAVSGPLETIVRNISQVVLAFDDWLNGPAIELVRKYKEELIGVGAVLAAGLGYVAIAAVVGQIMKAVAAIKLIIGVTRGWAAAQLLLNAAFWANPVGIVVAAVAALVAGVIWAYKNVDWFREGVNNAWKAISTGAKWVWDSVLKPFFNWLVEDAWPAVKMAFNVGWQAIKTVWDALGAAAKWTWENVLKPVFNWIKGGWSILWFAIKVGWEAGKIVFDTIGTVVKAMWSKYVSPVIDAFKAGWNALSIIIKQGYDSYIQPVIDAFGAAWDWVGDRLQAFWDKVKLAWEGIKATIWAVWEFLKPVRDGFGKFFDSIGELGSRAATAIKNAWSGLTNILKEPLRAIGRFLVGLPNNILGVEIPFIGDLHNWGNSLAGLRTGGVIRGPGSGTSDSILGLDQRGVPTVRVSNGEGIVPAAALTTPLGQAMFAALLDLPGYAGGGVPGGRGDGLNPGAAWLKDYIMQNFGVTEIGGRRSEDGYGEHSSGNAIDIMVGNNTALGNQIAGFLKANKDTLGLNGMIWQQRSYGYGGSWDGKYMADRGSPTQNHMDHIHAILGKGRGASAQAVGLPSGTLIDPTGRSTVAGSAGNYGPTLSSQSGRGRYVVDPKKVSRAQDRVTDRQNQLETAQMRLDEQLAKQASGATVKESTITNARNQVEKFQRELDQAKAELEEAQQGEYKEDKDSKSGSKSDDWSSVGGMIFSGFLEAMGFDGSVFKNIFETPNVKSAMAALNFGLGVLFPGEGEDAGDGGNPLSLGIGGDGGGGILSAGADVLAGIGEQAGVNFPDQAHAGTGANPGPAGGTTFDLRGSQLGVSPGAFEDKVGEMTAASKRYPTLGPVAS